MRALALLALVAARPLVAAEGDVVLDRPAVPAAGRQKALLTVGRFGRYAVLVRSAQGTSVQVVDRMAGPREAAGRPGAEDGRLDVFLERGEHRLLTEGHPRAAGEARLEVRGFAELSSPQPPMLVETKLLETSLGDFEQRSFWLVVKERRRVAVEAAGRNLADLRLWRDGQWLVDASPQLERTQPKVGRPLLACRLATELEPGLYLLTAYGGPSQPWAEEGEEHPLYLRFGLPRLPEAGRRRLVVSPFGIDRYLVPGAATYFRLELPEALPATLRAASFDPGRPFLPPSSIAEISKKSLPPVAEIDLAPQVQDSEPRREDAPGVPDRIVTVEAEAGQGYLLQHFDRRSVYFFRADGEYWISSVHSGHPQDSVDVTALLVRDTEKTPLREEVVEIDTRTAWKRRANLLAPLTVFLRIKETARYEIRLEGPEARARIEPFLTFRPERYQPPPLKGSGSTWDLDAGFYVFTAEPVKRGIATFTVRAKGLLDPALEAVGLGKAAAEAPERAAAVFPSVSLDRGSYYRVYLNEQPEVRSGVQLRKLPLDPSEPLFVSQRPGETVLVPLTVFEPGLLRAEAEDGSLLELSVDGGAPLKAAALAPGAHQVSVRYQGKDTVQYSLAFEPARLARTAALPPLPAEERPVVFETLALGAPRFLDLPSGSSATFGVRADRSGLYVLESTGLLATAGNLRSRVVTSFARDAGSGTGRNFELRQYLREGDYQLTVSTRPPSAGHLGLQLRRTRVEEGGFLLLRLPARATVKAGEAVSYRFTITRPGRFRVRALGLGRGFRCRLEDEDGWPLVPPGGPADVTRDFDSGRYRFVVLPEATDARVVSLIEPMGRRPPREGHGPHPLPLGQAVEHVWLEPEEGQERVPDTWELRLPGATDVSFTLGGGMEASLRLADGPEAPVVATLGPGQPAKHALSAGRYRLEVRSVRRNNRASYTVGAFPEALLPGMDREVGPPAELPLAVGEAGLVEMTSFGSVDVKARLYDASGGFLAASDDRPGDWNFQIATSLVPGRYLLRVDPVGASSGTTSVRLRAPGEEERPEITLPSSLEVRPGRTSLLFPLASVRGDLLLAQVRSAESLGLALEARRGETWVPLGSASGRSPRLEVPLADAASSGPLRLRLWSQDRRDAVARLSVTAIAAPRVKESELRRGLRLTPVAGLPAATAAAVLELDRPGLLRVAESPGLRFGAEPGAACRPATNGLVAVPGTRVYVVSETPVEPVRAERVVLASGQGLVVELPSRGLVPVEAAASAGPLLVRARSRSLPPGLRIGEAGERLPTSGAMAALPGFAVAVSLRPRKPLVVAFAAAPPAAPGPAGEATLEALALPTPPRAERLAPGTTDGALEGVSAAAYTLPPGGKRLRVGLSRGMAAVLSTEHAIEGVLATDEDAAAETVYTSAATLTVLQPDPGRGRFSVEAIPAEAPVARPGRPLQLTLAEAGALRLAVLAERPARLRLRGATLEAAFLAPDGTLGHGRDLAIAGPGTLLLRHRPGPVMIWLEGEGEDARSLWDVPGLAPRTAALPASLSLEGAAMRLAFERSAPALLLLRSATPLVTVLSRPGAPAEADVRPETTAFDALVPAGRFELLLRPAFSGALFGAADLSVAPVTPIGEGLGPEALLSPGGSRAFSFEVRQGGPVGVGVRASSEVVEATLLDAEGRRLGEGVTQMPTLAAGRYLLVLHAPSEGPAVRARPALAGLDRPPTDPPLEVVRRYFEPAEAERPGFSSRYIEEEAAPTYEEGFAEEPPVEEEEMPEEEPPPQEAGEPDGGER